MTKYRILLTGSEGAIGKTIAPALINAGHHVRGFDLRKSQYLTDYIIGNIQNVSLLSECMNSIDTIIHLAAETDDCDFMTRLLPSNIIAVYNILECARLNKIRRVILASSMQVYGKLFKTKNTSKPLGQETSPLNHYAVTKVFAETSGKMYAQRFNLSVICARIGWFIRNKEEFRQVKLSKFWEDSYLSYEDAATFFLKAVEAENIDFLILNAVSKPKYSELYDLQTAQNTIGYTPKHSFPEGLLPDFYRIEKIE